jgi:D-alanine--poly(phosphoribitol) ligase subunit 2
MVADPSTVDRVRLLIGDVLSIEVPNGDIDMIDAGLLDSFALVSLIAEIEQEFQLELSLEDLDVDQFRSPDRIAQLLAASLR